MHGINLSEKKNSYKNNERESAIYNKARIEVTKIRIKKTKQKNPKNTLIWRLHKDESDFKKHVQKFSTTI